MTPEQAAAAAKGALLQLGSAYTQCPNTLSGARVLGLTAWAFQVAGRAGVLGEASADTVAAALGFVAPDAIRDGWEAARRVAPPIDIARQHLAECCRWGRENLDRLPDGPRLAALAERVVLAAEPAGLPLFAAWRAMPVPEGGAGARVAVLAKLLREQRVGAHLLAIRASGLSPLEAVIGGPEGEAGAVAFGWQPPFPRPEPLLRRCIWAEKLADRIVAEAYGILDPEERVEFVTLADRAAATLSPTVSEHSVVS
jgi:hypothetical protein